MVEGEGKSLGPEYRFLDFDYHTNTYTSPSHTHPYNTSPSSKFTEIKWWVGEYGVGGSLGVVD